MSAKRFVLLVSALLVSGCSVTTMRPPEYSEFGPVRCTDSKAAPVIDTLIASALTGAAVYGFQSQSDQAVGLSILSAGVAGFYALSAIGGYDWAAKCLETKKNDEVRAQ